MNIAQLKVRVPAGCGSGIGPALDAFGSWREGLADALADYQKWSEKEGVALEHQQHRFFDLLDAMKRDRPTLAFVGEAARGKSELINAILFGAHGGRVLPTGPGRSTLCITELRCDEDRAPEIRLLPTETRTLPQTLDELGKDPDRWLTTPLDPADPDQLATALAETGRTRLVSRREAAFLGFETTALDGTDVPDLLPIPRFRYAIVNLHLPLLRRGLVLLDTPGTNGMLGDPEGRMLVEHRADALVFVCAADSQITSTERALWRSLERARPVSRERTAIVVLNKADLLLPGTDTAAHEVVTPDRRAAIARELGIPAEQVFPLSARRALVARIKQDRDSLASSGLPALEDALSGEAFATRQREVRDRLVKEIADSLRTSNALIAQRIVELDAELDETGRVARGGESALADAVSRIREEQTALDASNASFHAARAALAAECRWLCDSLDVRAFDREAAIVHERMTRAWTTATLREAMGTLLGIATRTFDRAERIAHHVESSAKGALSGSGTVRALPPPLDLSSPRQRLMARITAADDWRRSPRLVFQDQQRITTRFLHDFVLGIRTLLDESGRAAADWSGSIQALLILSARERQKGRWRRIAGLHAACHENGSASVRQRGLTEERLALRNQQLVIRGFLRRLHTPLKAL